ncbi:hypothetical protein [Streptomyces acidiscabies]|uniref:hypothetical protein n=1 Tax=Streptomyces acidiscabies TaxID=42234 RepID=UPI0009532664|nr:hypothetical protein [Streptomyces acidiscabies]
MHDHQQPVSWGEAAFVTLAGFAVIAVTAGILSLVGEETGMLAYPVLLLLVQWFFARHRFWGAAVAAGVAAAVVMVVLLEPLRDQFGRSFADSLTLASGLLSAMIAFKLTTRPRRRKLTLPR